MQPIVRHIKTSVPYKYLGEDKFQNMVTGVIGEVDEEKARKVFLFNVEASQIIHEYPLVEKLINSLKLKIDKP